MTTHASSRRRALSRPLALILALTAMIMALGIAGSTKAEAKPRPPVNTSVPISGTAETGELVDGTFIINRFTAKNGELLANGTFEGTITDVAGTVTNVTEQIALPVNLAQSAGSCEILNLVLGPLDLDLLGLQVHLDQVVLNITAQQGPGNLLGNLLCAVAGLLDGPAPLAGLLQGIANLLNQILGALG